MQCKLVFNSGDGLGLAVPADLLSTGELTTVSSESPYRVV